MTSLVVGISDCKVSRDPDTTIITYALGSCIGVALYDPVAHVAGLLHILLPDSGLHAGKAIQTPCMFADTGIPLLLRAMESSGARPNKLTVILAGGAQILDSHEVFQIGKRNYLAVRKALWAAGLMVGSEAIGGEVSRTVRLEVSTGRVWVREGGAPDRLLGTREPRQQIAGSRTLAGVRGS